MYIYQDKITKKKYKCYIEINSEHKMVSFLYVNVVYNMVNKVLDFLYINLSLND